MLTDSTCKKDKINTVEHTETNTRGDYVRRENRKTNSQQSLNQESHEFIRGNVKRKERMCSNKSSFKTYNQALRTGLRKNKEYGGVFRVYKCPYCGNYHITTKPLDEHYKDMVGSHPIPAQGGANENRSRP